MDKNELIACLKLAYHRAKCDIFYTSSNYCFHQILAYEESLEENITELSTQLMNALEKEDYSWFLKKDFLGDWYVTGKKREVDDKESKVVNHFRFMAAPSMHFQVFASYWIELVGQGLDASFSKDLYACRLQKKPTDAASSNGNYQKYQYLYGSWQRNAVQAISDALEKKMDTASVCLDVTRFYYSIKHDSFSSEKLGLEKSSDAWKVNNLFCAILQEWATTFYKIPNIGIPVGLVASPILANNALCSFDSLLKTAFHPLFYGRYADDIICVFSHRAKGKDAITYDDFFKNLERSDQGESIVYHDDGTWSWNDLSFNESKYSFHFFSGVRGRAEVIAFRRQLGERTSEWRALPDIPSPDEIPSKMLSFLDADNEEAKDLKDMHAPSVQRMQFSFLLRDCETFARTFRPDEWGAIRRRFLKTFGEFCMDGGHWFGFERFFPRVLALGILCKDYQEVADLLMHLSSCFSGLFDSEASVDCEIELPEVKNIPEKEEEKRKEKAKEIIQDKYQEVLARIIRTVFLQCSLSFSLSRLWKHIPLDKRGSGFLNLVYLWYKEINDKVIDKSLAFFRHDLGYFPLRLALVSKEQNPLLLLYLGGNDVCERLRKELPESLREEALTSASLCKALVLTNEEKPWPGQKAEDGHVPSCFAYLTRSFDDLDFVYDLDGTEESETSWENCQDVLRSYRGYGYREGMEGHKFLPRNSYPTYVIPHDDAILKGQGISIAVACVRMHDAKLEEILSKSKRTGRVEAYQRYTKLINSVLSCRNHIDYLVFPELAIPLDWFLNTVKKLQRKKINFVSGIEYQFFGETSVANCVCAGLSHTLYTYPSDIVFCQKKQVPAYEEAENIARTGNYSWNPGEQHGPTKWPPVIQHGNFFFSLLICSDLMNIEYRGNLRGKIDCLFVPEWNRSVTLYNDLVQASANDLHTFIVQCNNNVYGDCRIRAPYSQDYERDVVKAKGGDNDYFIVGTVKVRELRKYQKDYRPKMKDTLFKPFPIGFGMSEERKQNFLQTNRAKAKDTGEMHEHIGDGCEGVCRTELGGEPEEPQGRKGQDKT